MFLSIIILLSIWLLYATFDGKRDALYWYLYSGADSYQYSCIYKVSKNVHNIFTVQRSIVAFLIVVLYSILNYSFDQIFTFIPLCKICFFALALPLTFSLLHNGNYYLTRNKLDKNTYKDGFSDDSETSTSTLEISFPERMFAFFIGLLFSFISYII